MDANILAGSLVRFEFANGSAIEGYLRYDGDSPYLEYMIGEHNRRLWLNHPYGPLKGLTPKILREPPPILSPGG